MPTHMAARGWATPEVTGRTAAVLRFNRGSTSSARRPPRIRATDPGRVRQSYYAVMGRRHPGSAQSRGQASDHGPDAGSPGDLRAQAGPSLATYVPTSRTLPSALTGKVAVLTGVTPPSEGERQSEVVTEIDQAIESESKLVVPQELPHR